MTQITLPLEWKATDQDDQYLITAANKALVDQLDDWENWPHGAAIVVGPRVSGKSILGRIFAGRSEGAVIDDAHLSSDEELFFAWNRAQEDRKPLLLISSLPVAEWGIKLPDLRSRLASAILLDVPQPDEDMMRALLSQFFEARGLVISDAVQSFIEKRIERSYDMIERVARKIDDVTLQQKKPVTRNLVAKALDELDYDAGTTGNFGQTHISDSAK